MKRQFNILSSIIVVFLFSCSESFLDVPPVGSYNDFQLANEDGINKLLTGAYSMLNGSTPTSFNTTCITTSPMGSVTAVIHGGEALKGSAKTDLPWINEFNEFGLTSGNDGVTECFRYLYDAIDRCNTVLKILKITDDPNLTDSERTEIIAETRFLRAHYYFTAKRAFKNIPWVDETTSDSRVPNTINNDGITYVNIWPQIAEDMDFARNNLPETQTDVGRPNKWAADCYYAKILIYRSNEGDLTSEGFSVALTILNNVIANGTNSSGEKYNLLPYYYWNFSAAHENGPESVFAVQHTVNDGASSTWAMRQSPNGLIEGRFMGSSVPAAPGWGAGWGLYQPSQWFVDHFRVNEDGLPYLDMYNTNPNSVKSDYKIESSDTFIPETAPLDPRLDWSVSRRGIPCLDYGIMPGKNWIRNQNDGGPYLMKKWYVKNSEAGIYTADKSSLSNAINVCIIRYADVLLLAAECEARVGSLNNARDLVNQVRNRMVQNSDNPENWVKLDHNITNAANYSIGLYPDDGSSNDAFVTRESALDAILYERTLELGTEGHRFYDVVRFGKGEEEFNAFLSFTKQTFDFLNGEYTEVPDAILPIPRIAIDNSHVEGKATLTQNTGY